jgi:hypothetical protein
MGGGGSQDIPESFDRQASLKRASLVRDQWNDYKARFQPVEQQLISDMGTGDHTRFNDQGVERAQQGTETAFNSSANTAMRDWSRIGQKPTQDQFQAQATNFNLKKSASMADATNTANQYDIDRKNEVMSGGLGAASTVGRG